MNNNAKVQKLSQVEKARIAARVSPPDKSVVSLRAALKLWRVERQQAAKDTIQALESSVGLGAALKLSSPTKARKLFRLAQDTIKTLESLIAEDADGAAIALYWTATFATDVLTWLCKEKTAAFSAIAQEKFLWPVMYGPHPEEKRKADELVNRLGLGAKTNINLSSGKTFSWQVPANIIAFHLHQLAQQLRRAPMCSWTARDCFPLADCEVGWSSANVYSDDEKYRKQLNALETWGQRGAGKHLPALSKETAAQWVEATKELFLIVYGENFEEHPNLQGLRASVRETAKDAYDKKGGRAAVRKRMRQAVKQAWHSIAAVH